MKAFKKQYKNKKNKANNLVFCNVIYTKADKWDSIKVDIPLTIKRQDDINSNLWTNTFLMTVRKILAQNSIRNAIIREVIGNANGVQYYSNYGF